ncbi:spermidine synthase [Alicycliphilus sp. B1]|nr:spermidine synthase [Alicycliphilus sp. B1]
MSGTPAAQATLYVAERLNADFGFYLSCGRPLAERRSAWQHIEVFDNAQFGRVMRIDGCFMTSERDEFFYHEPMVHLPAIAHPGVRTALVVGGGDGGAAEELLKLPGIERVVLAELDGDGGRHGARVARRHPPRRVRRPAPAAAPGRRARPAGAGRRALRPDRAGPDRPLRPGRGAVHRWSSTRPAAGR